VAEHSTVYERTYSQSEQLRSSIEESGEVRDADRSTMGANWRIVKRVSVGGEGWWWNHFTQISTAFDSIHIGGVCP